MATVRPKTWGDLLRNPKALGDLFDAVRRLENLRIVTTDNVQRPIIFSPDNAIVDLNEISAPPPPTFEPPEPAYVYNAETIAWENKAVAAGGLISTASKDLAEDLILAIQASAFNSKIKYLLPLLGQNLAAARTPLRDALGVGVATNGNLVEGDFSEATGLQGNGTSKYLNTLITPGQLGTSNNGGIGYWENNIAFTGTAVIPAGCYGRFGGANDYSEFGIQLRSASRRVSWGIPGNTVSVAGAATNGHYYAQRSSATSRALFQAGVSIGSGSTSDAASGSLQQTIRILGARDSADDAGFPNGYCWAGRCACAYLTDGTMTSGEIADLHALLNTYLIAPTGR